MAFRKPLGLIWLCCAAFCGAQLHAAEYSIINLGDYSATQLNNAGRVVGSKESESSLDYFLWDNGTWTDLHYSPVSYPETLTDSGKILFNGFAPPSLLDTETGIASSLPVVGLSSAREIDDAGNVVGSTNGPDGYRGFIYWNGVQQDLSQNSGANGFNTVGQVVGYTEAAPDVIHATLFENGNEIDLGVLDGFVRSSAIEINDQGIAIGVSYDSTDLMRAFAYRNGQMEDLGDLGGHDARPFDINNHNQIVGLSVTATGEERPFLHQAGVMVDLNTLIDPASGWDLDFVYEINDHGQILGRGTLNGTRAAVLLTRVPEPSTYVMAAMGIVALLFARRRKR